MSDRALGPGWWQASDGNWYAPEQVPGGGLPAAPTQPQAYQAPYGQQHQMPYGQQYPANQPNYAPVPYGQPAPMMATKLCFACGTTVFATAAMCPQCGTMLGTPKDKTVAVLLAVFLAPWNWVYTYKRDAAKFWIGISLMVLGWILLIVVVGVFVILGVWIWAVVDAASKPNHYYQQFPHVVA